MRQASLFQVFICFLRYTYITALNQSCETHRRLLILNGQINDTTLDWSCKSPTTFISFPNTPCQLSLNDIMLLQVESLLLLMVNPQWIKPKNRHRIILPNNLLTSFKKSETGFEPCHQQLLLYNGDGSKGTNEKPEWPWTGGPNRTMK